jgi:uncharacterized protein YndB with AHSA1/START domain
MPSKSKTQAKGHARNAPGKRTESELVLARVFDAPRERVWTAWTDPAEFKRWWGPKGYTIPACTIDLRVGGKYLYCMRSPEGTDYWATGTYREIVPPRKFVATDSFADAKGNVVPASAYGMKSEMPLEMLVTVTFEDLAGKTQVTLRHAGLPAGSDQDGAEQGWSESFEKLAASLAEVSPGTGLITDRTKRQVVMSRVFNAPRDRVFHAYTDPKLIPKWWGLRRQTTTVDTMDVRRGGRWRYVCRDPDRTEYGFRGEYREVQRPERIVSTFEFEGMPGHIIEETATFEEQGGKTKVTITSCFETIEDLDGMLQSGMEVGARETWDRLEELLAKSG